MAGGAVDYNHLNEKGSPPKKESVLTDPIQDEAQEVQID